VPVANTEFQFQAANLNFKSLLYQWLVVAGARAQFKDWGSINGQSEYGFMLTAIDGQGQRRRLRPVPDQNLAHLRQPGQHR
jgi:hypothetical protein